MADENQPPQVKEPFSKGFGGDFILRTSDQAQFTVHRAILAMASPAFGGLFAIPQPVHHPETSPAVTVTTGIPIVDLTEDAETLDALLRCIYPTDRPAIDKIDLAIQLLQAADKYLVSPSCLTPIYFCILRASELGRDAYLRYGLSWRMGYRAMAVQASHDILTSGLNLMERTTIQRIIETSGDAEAMEALFSAKVSFDHGIQHTTAWVCIHLGDKLCMACLSNVSSMRGLANAVEARMLLALQEEWLMNQRVVVGVVQWAQRMIQVQESILKVGRCTWCSSPLTFPDDPPQCNITNVVDVGISLAIEWPPNKPDQTP